MNSLKGHITGMQSEGSLTMVHVDLEGNLPLEVMVIDTPETVNYLRNGREIEVLFKETELILSREAIPNISVHNRIPCRVYRLEEGKILTRIYLNSEAGPMTALLPTTALSTMQLTEGTALTALVKFNEIMLASR
ncbi:TOBE domain-containing protein [Robertkochia sediminum]|uniref:TOBE domain-containing protein n=1 Tax=Robertkochia sediminum TaxID=2785326 RepID=UPI0019338CDE|nr:TOBE domain-containing protein [Robertkochia sediminum]MBL7473236.1 TOBE domain-containing protein [Robertkochia sediminum]